MKFSNLIRKISLIVLAICIWNCFPDMERRKKLENDWFKIEESRYEAKSKRLRFNMKGLVRNPDLKEIRIFESEEEGSENRILEKKGPFPAGKFFAWEDRDPKKDIGWIRKIGVSKRWIRIELVNLSGAETELRSEMLVSENEKKILRKEFSIEAEGEIIRLDGREWKVFSELNTKEQALLQYIPKEEFPLFWTEMVSIHVYKLKNSQPDRIYSLLESTKKKDCPSVVWTKESKDGDVILRYYWEHSGCGRQPAMGEVARLFQGEYGIYNIRYDKKGKISESERRGWTSLLEKIPGN
ncbi:hypothetical protein EHQ61_11440 [Leptospira wolffii]|nr:hypothetical protein EHQ61_11440 [Leptospira wolffii]